MSECMMCNNLTTQVRSIASVTTAVAKGDLSQQVNIEVGGEIETLKDTVNGMVEQLRTFASEVTHVPQEVGTQGILGGQAQVEGVEGTWMHLTNNVNFMAFNLTNQTVDVDVRGEMLDLKLTVNSMVKQLLMFSSEVTRVALEVGTRGQLGGQAQVEGVEGTWRHLTETVNQMASNLTDQVRSIASVTKAVADGDLSQTVDVNVQGEMLTLKNTVNSMVTKLRTFASEVTRVALEVGTHGVLGGQAKVEGMEGTWNDLTYNVNPMASNLTDQVRSIASVTKAVAAGDLSQIVDVNVQGEMLALKLTVNSMVEQLRTFASEVTRVALEVGTQGELGGQAEVEGVEGTWLDLTSHVNKMASNLTDQVRSIASVTRAVAAGDLSQTMNVDVRGEMLDLKLTVNSMVEQLWTFASEVTRDALEVGTHGVLGGQAKVEDVSGTWRHLTDNVNRMASNLTDQVRSIASVTKAVAAG